MLDVIIPDFWQCYSQAISALLIGNPIHWMLKSEKIFPRAAKCTYESFGPSGSLQKFDALCLLPLNILNQKLFIIVWIWYITQFCLSILNLFYWIIVSCSSYVRIRILHQKTMNSISRTHLLLASHRAHLGHFFLLNQISKNTNAITFIELISELALNVKSFKQNENANETF